MFCVSCEGSFEYGDKGNLIEVATGAQTTTEDAAQQTAAQSNYIDWCEALYAKFLGIPPLFDLSSAPVLPKEGPYENDPSEALAAKLLMGWAMLDETCTLEGCSGSVPLMRDKKGQVEVPSFDSFTSAISIP